MDSRVGAKAMTKRCFPYSRRIEPGAFQKERFTGIGYTAAQSAENAGNTKRCFRIADHQVLGIQLSFLSIERDKRGSCSEIFYNNFMALDRRRVIRMERLPHFMQYEIGYIYHVINWPDPNGFKFLLHPR